MSFPESMGVWFGESRPFQGPMSLVVAGSTHYLLRDAQYELWSTDQDCLVFLTNAGNDPPAIPVTQPATDYPGAFVPKGALLHFQMVNGVSVNVGGVQVAITGMRVVALSGAAGNFQLNEYKRRSS